jgi:hypothetical protein
MCNLRCDDFVGSLRGGRLKEGQISRSMMQAPHGAVCVHNGQHHARRLVLR